MSPSVDYCVEQTGCKWLLLGDQIRELLLHLLNVLLRVMRVEVCELLNIGPVLLRWQWRNAKGDSPGYVRRNGSKWTRSAIRNRSPGTHSSPSGPVRADRWAAASPGTRTCARPRSRDIAAPVPAAARYSRWPREWHHYPSAAAAAPGCWRAPSPCWNAGAPGHLPDDLRERFGCRRRWDLVVRRERDVPTGPSATLNLLRRWRSASSAANSSFVGSGSG